MLCIGIVDAGELPRERSTLLVRFLAAGPLLQTTESGYEVTVELKAMGGKGPRWHIRHDALVWGE